MLCRGLEPLSFGRKPKILTARRAELIIPTSTVGRSTSVAICTTDLAFSDLRYHGFPCDPITNKAGHMRLLCSTNMIKLQNNRILLPTIYTRVSKQILPNSLSERPNLCSLVRNCFFRIVRLIAAVMLPLVLLVAVHTPS